MESIKNQILKERGLVKVRERKPGKKRDSFGRFSLAPKVIISGKRKTPMMRYLEQKYHLALEDVLVSGSLSIVAKRLGNEVDVSTISRWIKRFRLRYTEDNLPVCEDCTHYTLACDGGVCQILMDMEFYDLMLVKRQKLLEELR